MGFVFFSTIYPPLTCHIPITYDYNDSTPKKLERLITHKSKIMIHSGNWWSMKRPEDRDPNDMLNKMRLIVKFIKERAVNAQISGIMTCNEQPLDKTPHRVPYWIDNPIKMEPYIERSLENANLFLNNKKEILAPIYCTLQVNNREQAQKYFKEAYEFGHRYFSIGVSEFLSNPKYKFDGIKKIFDIILGIRDAVGNQCPIHISGLSSFNLIPFIKYLSANSCDGSTPVQSALAYGTLFNHNGNSINASKLNQIIPYINTDIFEETIQLKLGTPNQIKKVYEWFCEDDPQNKCECEICKFKSIKERITLFNNGSAESKAGEARVIHNLSVWERLINRINLDMIKDSTKWIQDFVYTQDSSYLSKVWEICKKSRVDNY